MGKEELATFRIYIAEYKTKLTTKFKERKSAVTHQPWNGR